MALIKKYLGYSHFINEFMMKIDPHYWMIGNNKDRSIDNDPLEVSCLIMQRLKSVLADNGIKGIILAQYTHFNLYDNQRNKNTKEVLECAIKAKLVVLDMFKPLEHIRKTNSKEYNELFNTHMTAKGNSFIAKAINSYLLENGIIKN